MSYEYDHSNGEISDTEDGELIATVACDREYTGVLLAAAPELLDQLDRLDSIEPDDQGDRVAPAGFLDKFREIRKRLHECRH